MKTGNSVIAKWGLRGNEKYRLGRERDIHYEIAPDHNNGARFDSGWNLAVRGNKPFSFNLILKSIDPEPPVGPLSGPLPPTETKRNNWEVEDLHKKSEIVATTAGGRSPRDKNAEVV